MKTAKKTPGRPFKKGHSGNPGGRPKTKHIAEECRALLAEAQGDKTKLRLLLERLYVDDPKTLLYFAYGKPIETTNATVQLESQQTIRPEVIALGREIAASLHETHNGNGH